MRFSALRARGCVRRPGIRGAAVLVIVLGLSSPAYATGGHAGNGICGLVGFSGVGEVEGFGLDLQLGYHWNHVFVAGRLLTAAELDLLEWNGSGDPRRLLEIGPVIGARTGWRRLQAEAYTGLSRVSGEWYDDSAYLSRSALGLPVGVSVLCAVSHEVGIGIGAFWNLNDVQSYSGGSLVFTLWR